jgi:hypothetical protein
MLLKAKCFAQWQAFHRYGNQLSAPLRATFALGCALLIFIMEYTAVQLPLKYHRQALSNSINELTIHNQILESQWRSVHQSVLGLSKNGSSEKHFSLQQEIKVIDAFLKNNLQYTLSPSQLLKIVNDMAVEHHVNLTRLETVNQPDLDVFARWPFLKTEGFTQQAVQLVFRSNYFTTLGYIQALENKNMPLLAMDLRYQVKSYPLGKVTLTLYFLTKKMVG